VKKSKPKILIGPLNKINIGAVPTVNKAFIDGLSDKYEFVPFYMEKRHAKSKSSNLDLINGLYFLKHYIFWIINIIIYKPTVVHFSITSYWNLEKSLIFLTTAKIFGVKITIGHLHGGAFDIFWKELGTIRKKNALKQLNKLDALIVASTYWKNFITDVTDIQKIKIVNNPIEYDFEKNISGNNEERNDEILFIGSIGRRKGVYNIIESSKLIGKKISIKIVGSEDRPNNIKEIKKLIRKYNLTNNIKLIESSKLKIKEKIELFNNSGIFLFPSYNENFPLVIIEAACAGLAIITTRVGALPEFFEHNKSVIFVEPGNVEQISEAILELINDAEKRRFLGKAAREVFIEKLGRKKILESLDNIYQSILRNI